MLQLTVAAPSCPLLLSDEMLLHSHSAKLAPIQNFFIPQTLCHMTRINLYSKDKNVEHVSGNYYGQCL
jgi:hypothetical protein